MIDMYIYDTYVHKTGTAPTNSDIHYSTRIMSAVEAVKYIDRLNSMTPDYHFYCTRRPDYIRG